MTCYLNEKPDVPQLRVFVVLSFNVFETGYFLRMLLGPANVRAARKDGRFKVKEEYNAYRVNALASHDWVTGPSASTVGFTAY